MELDGMTWILTSKLGGKFSLKILPVISSSVGPELPTPQTG